MPSNIKGRGDERFKGPWKKKSGPKVKILENLELSTKERFDQNLTMIQNEVAQ